MCPNRSNEMFREIRIKIKSRFFTPSCQLMSSRVKDSIRRGFSRESGTGFIFAGGDG